MVLGFMADEIRKEIDAEIIASITGRQKMDNFIKDRNRLATTYWIDGESHPEGGFFTAYIDGVTQSWYDGEGEFHRDDGLPAIVTERGGQCWYVHGLLHRGGGLPAVIYNDGREEFWYYGNLNGEAPKTSWMGRLVKSFG